MTERRSVLFIKGRRVNPRRDTKLIRLLVCLFDDLGYVVPYRRLCSAIGRKSTTRSERQLLRQYINLLRDMLLTHKAPYVIAVVHEVGYGLCRIAESPNSLTRRRVGNLPTLGRNLRRLREKAGLTQTALAKRSGTNRAYIATWKAATGIPRR